MSRCRFRRAGLDHGSGKTSDGEEASDGSVDSSSASCNWCVGGWGESTSASWLGDTASTVATSGVRSGATTLGLTILVLGADRCCSGGWGGSRGLALWLPINDLRAYGGGSDRRDGGGLALGLTINDLRAYWSGGGGLDLAVGNLGHRCNSAGSGDLTIRLLAGSWGGTAGRLSDDLNVDWRALSGRVVVVQVVEGAAEALVPGGVVTDGERVVAADREPGGVDGTSLRWLVELELVVGRNVASAALRVLEHATR